MITRHKNNFTTIRTEGAILPPDLLQRISEADPDLEGLKPTAYHLLENEKLNEAINRSWNRLLGAWESFKRTREIVSADQPGTTPTRERWLLPLFQELGFGRLQTSNAFQIENKSYPISHLWGKAPLHLVGFNVSLDKRTAGVAGAAQTSPHSMLQEFLNRSDDHLWAFLANGHLLRILRDNVSLTRQAFVEFDLQAMMEGEVYADFVLLWLLCHQSRVEAEKPEEFWLEKWSRHAQEQGTRALDQLRDGVKDAIRCLGTGFLSHPANQALRLRLRSGELNTQDYYRQLLRLVYRLIFLFVAEDRDLLLHPDADLIARKRYTGHYSSRRLRRMAERSRGSRHPDLYRAFRLVTSKLGSQKGTVELALPALGGFLFSDGATTDLVGADLPNRPFLEAVRSLAFTVDSHVLRPVDYKNLGSEELGSVYESLLELHPEINVDVGTFSLSSASGHERKTTGSYYTPTSLIRVLLDSALDPVVEDRLGKVRGKAVEMQEEALLDIKVCDPASGSGHFLIAAAHRLAKRLATIRTDTGEPAPEATRTALRNVIAKCIFGVDINPMAVELCKVSLWMEALEPGKPLSFLDAQIKCGNSLIGVGPGLDISEIPDDAFRPAFGDDKATATALRRRNKREREGQMGFRWDETVIRDAEDLAAWVAKQSSQLEAMPEDEVVQIQKKEQAYHVLLSDSQYLRHKLQYDLWTAAFFWPIPKGDAECMLAPTQQELNRIHANRSLDAELTRRAQEFAGTQNFFHWELEFSTVFVLGQKSGFDVVLGNPPWERIKLQEQEFFAGLAPDIAQAPNKAARQKLIKKLPNENPSLWRLFEQAKADAENASFFVRNSGRFPLTAVGDVNTYALFAGHVRHILSAAGRAGIIVPTGIATDTTTKRYFADVVNTRSLVSLFDFENREKIFKDVYFRQKFCLLTLSGTHGKQAEFVFFATDVAHIKDLMRRFSLAPHEITLFNPNTHTLSIFRTRPDAEITQKIYQHVPVLVNERLAENRWGIRLSTMFHMSNDSHLFISEPQEAYLPLYESKLFYHFDHRHSTYEGAKHANLNVRALPQLSETLKNHPDFSVRPRYWVPLTEIQQRLSDWDKDWLIAYRGITSVVNERTSIFSLLPRVGVGNSAPILFIDESNLIKAPCLLANMCCLPFDYITRQKIGGINLSYTYLRQLPVIPPDTFSKHEIDFINPRVLELVYSNWELQPFAKDMGYAGPPFRWDEERRAILRAELDAYYAHLYGLNRKQLRYILDPADLTSAELGDILDPWEDVANPLEGYQDRAAASTFPGETFRVLKAKEIKKYGEYRTRRLVLEAWERMVAIDFDVEAYVPMTDPSPADPRLSHPNRDGTPYTGPGLVMEAEDGLKSLPTSSSPTVSEEFTPVPAPNTTDHEKEEQLDNPSHTGNLAPSTNFSLYKCNGCGQMVMGFDKENHINKMHGGDEPELVKL